MVKPPRLKVEGTYQMIGNCYGSCLSSMGLSSCLVGPREVGGPTLSQVLPILIWKTTNGPEGRWEYLWGLAMAYIKPLNLK